MRIEIKNRYNNKIILCGEYESIKECLDEDRGADLREANLCGADLRGADYNGEKLDKKPIQLSGLKYYILITKEYIKIECELHKVSEWKKFTNKEILAMDGKEGLIWWKKYKKFILDANKLHKEE